MLPIKSEKEGYTNKRGEKIKKERKAWFCYHYKYGNHSGYKNFHHSITTKINNNNKIKLLTNYTQNPHPKRPLYYIFFLFFFSFWLSTFLCLLSTTTHLHSKLPILQEEQTLHFKKKKKIIENNLPKKKEKEKERKKIRRKEDPLSLLTIVSYWDHIYLGCIFTAQNNSL